MAKNPISKRLVKESGKTSRQVKSDYRAAGKAGLTGMARRSAAMSSGASK